MSGEERSKEDVSGTDVGGEVDKGREDQVGEGGERERDAGCGSSYIAATVKGWRYLLK